MELHQTVKNLFLPELREEARRELRDILLDGAVPEKLEVVSLLKGNNISFLNDLLSEILLMDENASVRMTVFSALCWTGSRDVFPVLVECVMIEEDPLAKSTMRMHLEIFIEKYSITSSDLEFIEKFSHLDLTEFTECPECNTSIKQFPCLKCGYGQICGICFAVINGSNYVTCPICGKDYHTPHIRIWLNSTVSCPICKSPKIAEIL